MYGDTPIFCITWLCKIVSIIVRLVRKLIDVRFMGAYTI